MVSLLREILKVTRSQEDQSSQVTTKQSGNSHSSGDRVGPILLARKAELRKAKNLTPGPMASMESGCQCGTALLWAPISYRYLMLCAAVSEEICRGRLFENSRVLTLEAFAGPQRKKLCVQIMSRQNGAQDRGREAGLHWGRGQTHGGPTFGLDLSGQQVLLTKIAREGFLHERNMVTTELEGAGQLWGLVWPRGAEDEAGGLARWRGAHPAKATANWSMKIWQWWGEWSEDNRAWGW